MEPRCVDMNITCALGGGTLQWLRRERTLPSWSGNEAMVQMLLHHHQEAGQRSTSSLQIQCR